MQPKRPGLCKHRNSPYWYYRFYVDGIEFRRSTRERGKREALLVALRVQREVLEAREQGVVVKAPPPTLGEVCSRWFEYVGSHCKDAPNIRSILRKLQGQLEVRRKGRDRKYLRDESGAILMKRVPGLDPKRPVTQLSLEEVAHLYDQRIASGNSPNTANRELTYLHAVLTWASQRGAPLPSWVPQIKSIKRPIPKGKVRYLFPDEEAALLAALDPGDDPQRVDQYHVVIALLDLGARYGEVVSLMWEDVDLKNGALRLYRPKVNNNDVLILTQRLQRVLEDRYARRGLSPYVFPGTGKSGHRAYAVKGIREAIDKAGINAPHKVARYGKATVHSLRDTYASKIVSNGGSLYDVQKTLGHASPQMSQKYAHLQVSDASRRAAEILNRLNGATPPNS